MFFNESDSYTTIDFIFFSSHFLSTSFIVLSKILCGWRRLRFSIMNPTRGRILKLEKRRNKCFLQEKEKEIRKQVLQTMLLSSTIRRTFFYPRIFLCVGWKKREEIVSIQNYRLTRHYREGSVWTWTELNWIKTIEQTNKQVNKQQC